MKKILSAILFDFDGVLCSDYFYQTLEEKDSSLYNKVNEMVFRHDNNKVLVKDWMRGAFDHIAFNKKISTILNADAAFLDDELIRGIKKMKLNSYLLDFAKSMKMQGVKTAVLTDNMDVFESVTVPHFKLDKCFNNFFSSSSYKMLKGDQEGELINIALKKLGIKDSNWLVVDDWPHLGELVSQKGGHFYLHPRNGGKDQFDEFYKWFQEKFSTIKRSV